MTKKFKRLIWLGYFLIGVILVFAAPFFSGSADLPPKMAASVDVYQQFQNGRIQEASAAYTDESKNSNPDSFSLGIAAFTIAMNSKDPSWSRAALKHFDMAEQKYNDLPILTAFKGAAYSVASRDYPIKGILLAFPGPGFVRIYDVLRSKSLLNKAYEAAPDDPVIRLMRASSFSGIPGIFGTKETGRSDFDTLLKMISDSNNTSEIINDPGFGAQVLMGFAMALEADDEPDAAKEKWQLLVDRFPDTAEAKVAEWKLK